MNVLLTNYRYFVSGGPERYLFNLSNELEYRGHNVVPFSIDYSRNNDTPYSKYFVSPLGSHDQVYFDEQSKSPATVLKTLSRLFYSPEVSGAVKKLIAAEKPDVAYVLHYLRKLSPSLLAGIKAKGVPLVVRLSDYAMLCPQAHCLRNDQPCTQCVNGNIISSIKFKCVKDSLPASILNGLATWFHTERKYFDLIDTFVTTNMFMYRMMVEAGYHEERLFCLPTFTNINHFSPQPGYTKSDYFVYVGRLDPLKGLHILLEAVAILKTSGYKDINLQIAGIGDEDYIDFCKNFVNKNNIDSNVKFLDRVNFKSLPCLLSKALFSVIPSMWYENLPNSLLESYACGTPVIASNIGSLTDSITPEKTGMLFAVGNPDDLALKIKNCLTDQNLLHDMSFRARREAEEKYSPAVHIDGLLTLFRNLQ